jgi:hypothetical protein
MDNSSRTDKSKHNSSCKTCGNVFPNFKDLLSHEFASWHGEHKVKWQGNLVETQSFIAEAPSIGSLVSSQRKLVGQNDKHEKHALLQNKDMSQGFKNINSLNQRIITERLKNKLKRRNIRSNVSTIIKPKAESSKTVSKAQAIVNPKPSSVAFQKTQCFQP